MECPHCKLPMVKKVRINGQVYWECKMCFHIEETNELEPPYNGWQYGYEEE